VYCFRLASPAVHVGSGMLFVGCALLMWFRKHEDEAVTRQAEKEAGFWSALWTVFLVVFVAEWGDLTQIGTAGFQAKWHAWLTILLASTLALWSVTALAVFVGNRAGKLLDPKLTQRVAAVAFMIIGAASCRRLLSADQATNRVVCRAGALGCGADYATRLSLLGRHAARCRLPGHSVAHHSQDRS
jgi:putative Ca2+/H+ antiporter (TMEM165/GDT1 family)